MPDNKKQAMITIKKADGSTVRVSLDEFKKIKEERLKNTEQGIRHEGDVKHEEYHVDYKNVEHDMRQEEDVMNIIPLTHEEKKSEDLVETHAMTTVDDMLPQVASPHELAMTTPVEDYFEDMAVASLHADDFDHRSLLDEDFSEIQTLEGQGARHVTHEDIVNHTIKNTAMHRDDTNITRRASLVTSWKKGIRNDGQFLDYATKVVEEGGLSMSREEAEKTLATLKKEHEAGQGVTNFVPSTKKSEPIIQKPIVKKQVDNTTRIPKLTNPIPIAQKHQTPAHVMQDIEIHDKRITMGPEEEIEAFSLVDFRRLSRDIDTATDMFLAKFNQWKEDDFLLYMRARDAWYRSPLFLTYANVSTQSLQEQKPVEMILQSQQDGLSDEEYHACVEINKALKL